MNDTTKASDLEVIATTTPNGQGSIVLLCEVEIDQSIKLVGGEILKINGDDIEKTVYDKVNRVANHYGYKIKEKTDTGYTLQRM